MKPDISNWNRSYQGAVSSTYWAQWGAVGVNMLCIGFIPFADVPWEWIALGFTVGVTLTAIFWAHTARGWLWLLNNQVQLNQQAHETSDKYKEALNEQWRYR